MTLMLGSVHQCWINLYFIIFVDVDSITIENSLNKIKDVLVKTFATPVFKLIVVKKSHEVFEVLI